MEEFRKISETVPFCEKTTTDTHNQHVNTAISSWFIFFERGTSTSPAAHKSTSSSYDQLFRCTQIAQVGMNIDYKLQPIADKSVANIFKTLVSIAKLLYHLKRQLHCIFLGFIRPCKVNNFIKTDSHGRHIPLNKLFLEILSVNFWF